MDTKELLHHIEMKIIPGLNDCQKKYYKAMGYTLHPPSWDAKERSKYIALDQDGAGYFLIEKATGEIFNIKGYGVPDKNKKKKADLGNILEADPAGLWDRRYNYLR